MIAASKIGVPSLLVFLAVGLFATELPQVRWVHIELETAVLVGNLALRTGKAIEWDSAGMRAVNSPEADPFIRPEFRSGWSP